MVIGLNIFSSGLRWTLAQLLMQKSKLGLSNPLDMLYHVQPWMIAMVLPFAVSFEGNLWQFFKITVILLNRVIGFSGIAVASSCKFFNYTNLQDVGHTLWTVLLGAFIAFCMECSEYLVITCTSSLTLSIAGIFKVIISVLYLLSMYYRFLFFWIWFFLIRKSVR